LEGESRSFCCRLHASKTSIQQAYAPVGGWIFHPLNRSKRQALVCGQILHLQKKGQKPGHFDHVSGLLVRSLLIKYAPLIAASAAFNRSVLAV